jgi:hypothetical protein
MYDLSSRYESVTRQMAALFSASTYSADESLRALSSQLFRWTFLF